MRKIITVLVCCLFSLASACTFNRANILALSEQQNTYYADLTSMLKKNRSLLETGLVEQVRANRTSRLNIMEWERDLQKGEILLQVDSNVTGNQRLLAEKLAQLNLESLAHFQNIQTTQAQVETILELYDALIQAVAAVQKNNTVIIEYLASDDEEFALRSLDVAGIVRAISGIRDVQEALADIEERSEEQKEAGRQRVQVSIERARDALLKAFQAGGGD